MADALRITMGCPFSITGATVGYSTHTIDTSTDWVEFIFQAAEDATITKLGCKISAVTTPPVLRISIRAADATSGRAGATILGATNNALATWTPSVGWTWQTLSETCSVTRGAYYGIVVEYSSGTVDGTHLATLSSHYSSTGIVGVPYPVTVAASSGTKQPNLPCFGYASSSKVYGYPSSALTEVTFDSGTAPMEVGAQFTIPVTWFHSYKVTGVRMHICMVATGKLSTMSLYSGTTALQTVDLDHDCFQAAAQRRMCELYFDESTLTLLRAGQTYTLAFAPQTATSDLIFGYLDVATSDDFAAYEMGTNMIYASRDSGGGTAFTATNTRKLLIDLIFTDIVASQSLEGGLQQ